MTITVYGASSASIPSVYLDAAAQLGKTIAARGHTLVNGAGRAGLMHACAEGVLEAGGKAIGVIPHFMVSEGWEMKGMSQLIEVGTMHERKTRMAFLGDACIALPGGPGTLEELLEVITWKQLGLYLKPIVILNTGDYFAPLLALFARAASEHFMREAHQQIWQIASTPEEAVALCERTPLWDKRVRKFAAL